MARVAGIQVRGAWILGDHRVRWECCRRNITLRTCRAAAGGMRMSATGKSGQVYHSALRCRPGGRVQMCTPNEPAAAGQRELPVASSAEGPLLRRSGCQWPIRATRTEPRLGLGGAGRLRQLRQPARYRARWHAPAPADDPGPRDSEPAFMRFQPQCQCQWPLPLALSAAQPRRMDRDSDITVGHRADRAHANFANPRSMGLCCLFVVNLV